MKKTWLQAEVHCNVILQSWTQNGARAFRVAAQGDLQPSGARSLVRPRMTRGSIGQDQAVLIRAGGGNITDFNVAESRDV